MGMHPYEVIAKLNQVDHRLTARLHRALGLKRFAVEDLGKLAKKSKGKDAGDWLGRLRRFQFPTSERADEFARDLAKLLGQGSHKIIHRRHHDEVTIPSYLVVEPFKEKLEWTPYT